MWVKVDSKSEFEAAHYWLKFANEDEVALYSHFMGRWVVAANETVYTLDNLIESAEDELWYWNVPVKPPIEADYINKLKDEFARDVEISFTTPEGTPQFKFVGKMVKL